MTLGEKLIELRAKKGWTQEQVAKKIGISNKSISRFETDERIPKKSNLVKLAQCFDVELDYLLDNNMAFVLAAQEASGTKGRISAQKLIENANTFFAGGDIPDEDKDAVMQALQNAYWQAKEINKKYTPKKYRKEDKNSDEKK